MITLWFLWGAAKDTFRFICWMFKWAVILMFKAVVAVTICTITAIVIVAGWIVAKITGLMLKKAGVDTSNWKKPDWDRIDHKLGEFNSRLDRKLKKAERARKHKPITIDEMILYDIIDDD